MSSGTKDMKHIDKLEVKKKHLEWQLRSTILSPFQHLQLRTAVGSDFSTPTTQDCVGGCQKGQSFSFDRFDNYPLRFLPPFLNS